MTGYNLPNDANCSVEASVNGLTESTGWKVEFPDGLTCVFSGKASVKLDGVGVNAAITYTLAIKPDSEMIFA